MKLPSEVDTYTFDELADCQDFDHNDKFVAFDKAAELWSHIIELREALEILDDVCDGEIGCWCGEKVRGEIVELCPRCRAALTIEKSIQKWGE